MPTSEAHARSQTLTSPAVGTGCGRAPMPAGSGLAHPGPACSPVQHCRHVGVSSLHQLGGSLREKGFCARISARTLKSRRQSDVTEHSYRRVLREPQILGSLLPKMASRPADKTPVLPGVRDPGPDTRPLAPGRAASNSQAHRPHRAWPEADGTCKASSPVTAHVKCRDEEGQR